MPAAGPLEQVAGLLVARAAPFEPVVQRQLLAGFGLTVHNEPAEVRAVRLAQARLKSLARSTGTPVSVTRALQVWVTTPDRQIDGALRAAQLVTDPDVDATALVRALRDAYGLSIGPVERLDPALRWQWQRWTGRTRRRGADLLPPELTSTVLPVQPWLTYLNLACDQGVVAVRDDARSRLSALVHRQLAVAGAASVEELAVGVWRADPNLRHLGVGLEPLIGFWARYQSDLHRHGELLVRPSTTDAWTWSTPTDRLLVAACRHGGARYRELTHILEAAGTTPGGADQQLVHSPVLRPAGQRGRYVLVGEARDGARHA